MLKNEDVGSSIVNEVIRAIISQIKKNTNKKYTSRYVLKILLKRVVYLLVCSFKAFKKKKSAYKNIWTEVTYYIMGLIFCASFLRV